MDFYCSKLLDPLRMGLPSFSTHRSVLLPVRSERDDGNDEAVIHDGGHTANFLNELDRAIEARKWWVLTVLGRKAVATREEAGAGDRLRSRQIQDQLVVADLLDDLDHPNGALQVVVLAGNHVKTTTHYINGEDATTVGGVRRIWRR
ncbi:hypothetical protein ACLOJK_004597 [Asimina triloba]